MRSLRLQSSFRSLVLPGLLALLCACSFKAPALLEGDASPDGGPGSPGADGPEGEIPFEPLELMMSATSMDVVEEATVTIEVRLRFKPAADVTLTLTSSDPGAASVTSSLTFTPANYATAQSLVITGVQDSDVTNEAVTITISAPGIPNSSLTINVIDNDTMGLVLSPTMISLGEATSASFTVRLSAQPAGDTTVSISSDDTGAASVTTSSPLTFTASNWNNPQNVVVAGVDDIDMANESVAINVGSTGMASRIVTANVVDNDTQVVQMSPSDMIITEGSNGSVSVRLSFQPAGDVDVAVVSSNPAVATASTSSLRFTPSTYATPQTVTITGEPDANAAQDSAIITASRPGATSATTRVTVNDVNTMAIETNFSSISVYEWGSTSFSVKLSAQPIRDTIVSVGSSDPEAASTSPAMLTFTSSNWNVGQTVTVNGVQDSDPYTESVEINLISGALNRIVSVTVFDDDPGCGNGICEGNENYYSCPEDCPYDCGPVACVPP